ncbi:MAG: 3-oxoacyl-ACP synthase III [Deltaproteobacteria bacterium]|nr:3-oxoacyl-ACP synthase III [Deltaproteobacteria bacterium]
MQYNNVSIAAFGYELPPNVVTSDDIEKRLEPLYAALHFKKGQLESLTGIQERRFWDPGFAVSEGAIRAGRKAIDVCGLPLESIRMLVYGGVCRDNLEPATACAVSHSLGLGPATLVYDVSNACLGILNGMVQVADAIELGHIEAGLVVSCESSRQIVDITIDRLLDSLNMDVFKQTVATLTGGSGAVAVVLSRIDTPDPRPKLLGGVVRSDLAHHALCTWGPDTGIPASGLQVMNTDSVGVLQNGVALGVRTFEAFKHELQFGDDQPDKIICHQVGATHQDTLLRSIGIPKDKDFTTFRHLGNIGTVSLPITAAMAAERGFLEPGDRVGLLGIGSGLNCMMLGLKW